MPKIPKNVSFVLNTLTKNGYEAYIVGGCVRDFCLGLNPADYDVTTSAKPEDVINLFKNTVPTGLKHGTVTVLIQNQPIEVTTFRTEGHYTDSRHPENVEFVTDIKEDLSRRDFTVNALAYNENSGIVDLFGGVGDLNNKILKAVGNPKERFEEDALRILRLFRFASQLDFKIEENTLNSALELQSGLEKISRERIFSELIKAVAGKKPEAIYPLINSGGLAFLGINKTPDFKYDNPDLRLFSLLNSTENPVKVLKSLKASNKYIDFTEKMIKLLPLKTETKEEIKNALFLTDEYAVKALFEYQHRSDKLIKEIIRNKEPYLISHLAVSGKDLADLGFKGKAIGQMLEQMRREVVKDPQKNKKDILTALTK